MLLGDDGFAFASPDAFFAALQPGDEVEVHGQLQSGARLHAASIEIEDHRGVARIEGLIVGLDNRGQPARAADRGPRAWARPGAREDRRCRDDHRGVE
jgi:hypothetical protein